MFFHKTTDIAVACLPVLFVAWLMQGFEFYLYAIAIIIFFALFDWVIID